MASLLRSIKIIRSVAGAARTLILNSSKNSENVILKYTQNLSHFPDASIRDFSSKYSERLEPLLQRIDTDVKRYGRINRKDIDEILEEIRHKNSITSSQCLLIIRCCGELVPEEPPEQRTQLVQHIWGVLSDRGIPLDISHYNALLRVYIENEHEFSPAAFLDELEKKGIPPNRVTYQRLMWRYCQAGDVDGATRVLERMRELSLPVSEPVLNALVMGHARLGDAEGARAVLAAMAGAGLQPSGRTYALLACGHARTGDLQGINDTIKQCAEKEVIMTDRDLMDIIEALAINGHSEHIDSILEKMQKGMGYNQDAVNCILRLINLGFENAAIKVFQTMIKSSNLEEKDPFNRGAFFPRQLVKAKRSAENIVSVCKELQAKDLCPRAIFIAAEEALHNGEVYISKVLLKELKESGLDIRQHYFWPLLVKEGKEKDHDALLDILRLMRNEFTMGPSGETLRDYVIPFLKDKRNPAEIVLLLQSVGVNGIHASRTVIISLLDSGNLKEAAAIASEYRPWGQISLLFQPLVQALNKTYDVQSFVTVLHAIHRDPKRVNDNELDEEQNSVEKEMNEYKEGIGRVVFSAVRGLKSHPQYLETLFELLMEKGLGISETWAARIQELLGENMTNSISDNLAKLTSTDLELSPMKRSSLRKKSPRIPETLERLIAQTKAQGRNTTSLYKQLFSMYAKLNDKDKIDQLLSTLEAENEPVPASSLAQLVFFYSQQDDLANAVKCKEQLRSIDPDLPMYDLTILNLALVYIKNGKVDEALQTLENEKRTPQGEPSFSLNNLCWKVLNQLAELGEAEKLKRALNVLLERQYTAPSNTILGPLIKVHILKDDLESALKEFDYCCKTYRCTPWKAELTRRLIELEDATRLQQVTDMSTEIHGEINSLYDLVLAFVECGRLRQARRILETPGLRTRTQKLTIASERYEQEGKTEYLEGLIEATKELSHIDRSEMFFHLLVSYCKAEQTDKALGLWTLIQEQGEVSSDKFLTYLADHLRSKNMDIPFSIPKVPKVLEQSPSKKVEDSVKKAVQKAPMSKEQEEISHLMQVITAGDVEEAIRLKKSLKTNLLSNKCYSELVWLLFKSDRLTEATTIAIEAMKNSMFMSPILLKSLIRKLAHIGDIATLKEFEKYLNSDRKMATTFDTMMVQAKFVNGDHAQHINELEQLLETDINECEKSFPRTAALSVIAEEPQLWEKCHKIAVRLADNGLYVPANILWLEYRINGKLKEADELWDKYLVNCDRLLFRRILQHSFVENDVSLAEWLIEKLHQNKQILPTAVASAYSRLIDIFLQNGQIDSAKKALEKGLSRSLTREHFNDGILKKLDEASQK